MSIQLLIKYRDVSLLQDAQKSDFGWYTTVKRIFEAYISLNNGLWLWSIVLKWSVDEGKRYIYSTIPLLHATIAF